MLSNMYVVGKKNIIFVLIGIVVIWLFFEILNFGFSLFDKKINIYNNKILLVVIIIIKIINKVWIIR